MTGAKSHLAALDGFRALLALWVYLGHLADAAGYSNGLLARHALAVDLFMVLSGFLMVRTWKGDAVTLNVNATSTTNFYLARFFRIAPLYYFLLLACWFVLPTLSHMHNAAQQVIPPPWATQIDHYQPNTAWTFDSLRWLWLHTTFLFGAIPGMESSTPLPDWSLSLEMQFYFVFPLILVITRKAPIILVATCTALLAWGAPGWFGNYLDPGSISHFGQPSFLPYRLNAFFAGMVVGIWDRKRHGPDHLRVGTVYAAACAAICIAPLTKPVMLAFLIFVVLVSGQAPRVSKLFSLRPLRFVGDISYSIYLVHVLIIIPAMYLLVSIPSYLAWAPIIRFLVGLMITLPLVILISHLLYRLVELPSIRIGRLLSNSTSELKSYPKNR